MERLRGADIIGHVYYPPETVVVSNFFFPYRCNSTVKPHRKTIHCRTRFEHTAFYNNNSNNKIFRQSSIWI